MAMASLAKTKTAKGAVKTPSSTVTPMTTTAPVPSMAAVSTQTPAVTVPPSYTGLAGANRLQQGVNDWLGTNYGNTNYMYTNPDGTQGMANLAGNPEALSYFNNQTGYDSGAMQYDTPASTSGNFNLGNIATGVNAAAGLANAYLGYKNYKLGKDMFNFEKAATNRNIANQASEYNTGIQNAGEVGMSLAGNTMTPEARAARQAQLNSQKISTAPIG